MRKIKLMPDYHCYPLWEESVDEVGNINPSDLPISDDLKMQLIAWAQLYDSTLNMDDPICSGFANGEIEAEFEKTGNSLGERLQCELGPEFYVVIKV